MRRCHALHITVVLSKAAHSGPSVCLRARAPCPLRASRPGADRAERAGQAAGVSVQCDLQVLALPRLLGSRHVETDFFYEVNFFCFLCKGSRQLLRPVAGLFCSLVGLFGRYI